MAPLSEDAMHSIRIGVIGAGLIGRKHLRYLAAHPGFALAGIADIDTEGAAAAHPGVPVFADYRALLAQVRPEAVVVAAPNRLHAEIGIACARAGVHFIMEKPVTDTLESARDLIDAVAESGVKTLVGHHRRHHGPVGVLRESLEAGLIGPLVGVSGLWATHKPAPYFEAAPWRREPGGGPVLINLIHEIDLLRCLAGEIVAVAAIASSRRRGFAVEDSAAAVLEFESGALGTFLLTDGAVSPWTTEQGFGESPEFPFSGASAYRFVGASGALEFPRLVHWSQEGGAPDWNRAALARELFAPRIDPYVAQLDHFRDVIRHDAPSMLTVADGAHTLAATLAVSEAAASGHRVELARSYARLRL
jgi:predicted dehydrogenase